MKNFERYINELAADFEKNGHECMLPMKRQCHLHDRCVECFISWALDDPEIPQENACPELIDIDDLRETNPVTKSDNCNLDLFGETL